MGGKWWVGRGPQVPNAQPRQLTAITMSASRHTAAGSGVCECMMVTVASRCMRRSETGIPTMFERPITAALWPAMGTPDRSSSSMQPCVGGFKMSGSKCQGQITNVEVLPIHSTIQAPSRFHEIMLSPNFDEHMRHGNVGSRTSCTYLRGARHREVKVGEAPLLAPRLLMRVRLGEPGHVQRMKAVNVFLGADTGEHDVFVDVRR